MKKTMKPATVPDAPYPRPEDVAAEALRFLQETFITGVVRVTDEGRIYWTVWFDVTGDGKVVPWEKKDKYAPESLLSMIRRSRARIAAQKQKTAAQKNRKRTN